MTARQAKTPRPTKRVPWKGLFTTSLRRESIDALISGEVPFVCIHEFLAPARCAELTRRFLESDPPIYKEFEYSIVKTLQLGMLFTQMRRSHADCLEEIESNNRTLRRFYAGGDDPLLKMKRAMEESAGYRAVDASNAGLPLSTDLFRAAMSGMSSPLHTDAYGAKPSPIPARFRHMFSWNVYFQMPERGGELCVYRKRPAPGDRAHIRPGHEWAYRRSVVAERPRCVYRPEPGDLVLFNASNYHEVFKIRGPVGRASAQSYCGIDDERSEVAFFV